jgi:hypothetical protein
MKKLYRYRWDIYRMGTIEGIFVADDDAVAQIEGSHVYFGEILGKHSDVQGRLEAEHFKVLTGDQDFIAKFEELGCSSGHNPFHYLENEE